MNLRRKREFLRRQIIEAKRMFDLVSEHPLMGAAYGEKLEALERELAALPEIGSKEAKTVLFFWGEPVRGSLGIDANFVGKVIEPFQSMVMADYADRWRGRLGTRGIRVGERESRLLLTGLPRGSFGLELSKADSDELFEEDQLSDTLAHVTRLIDSSARSDTDFVSELSESNPRVVNNLKSFLGAVAKGNAGFEMQTGDLRLEINPTSAKDAFARVSDTSSSSEDIVVEGQLRGILLDSWQFNFTDSAGFLFRGKLSANLSTEQAQDLLRNFFTSTARAMLTKNIVAFRNGTVRTTYILNDIVAVEELGSDPIVPAELGGAETPQVD